MPFAEPDQGFDGVRINPRDVVGHLLLVWPTEYIDHSPTKYTKPGQASDVIVVDVVDLDAVDADGTPGLLCQSVWWRQSKLIQSLRRHVGSADATLAWMGQGGATQGNNAPFILVSATKDPGAVTRAQDWLARHPDFKPSVAEEVQDHQPAPGPGVPLAQESMLERMARQAREGAGRLPPPPTQSEGAPGF